MTSSFEADSDARVSGRGRGSSPANGSIADVVTREAVYKDGVKPFGLEACHGEGLALRAVLDESDIDPNARETEDLSGWIQVEE